jgi:hypothetical protein
MWIDKVSSRKRIAAPQVLMEIRSALRYGSPCGQSGHYQARPHRRRRYYSLLYSFCPVRSHMMFGGT